MSGNFTVLSQEQEERLRKLEAFFATIRDLANKTNLYKTAPVYEALSEVDPNWNYGGATGKQADWGAGHGGEG
jgi:hypothetical protein